MKNRKKSNGRRNKNKNKNGEVKKFSDPPFGGRGIYTMDYFSRSSPGRARVKTSFTASSATGSALVSFTGFNAWNGQARSLLTPFAWFRVVEMTIKPFVYGGAASSYTLAFNYSNSNYGTDTSLGSILDDDYSAFATSINQPELHIPRKHLLDGGRLWYNAFDGSGGIPSNQDLIQGVISYIGDGGAIPTTVLATITVEMVLEFHTLI